ncbi:MAG: 3'-5' exonuclease [Deltaproteobacteria bacterium]|nr:3'-5' exonuclease [Deltaproteobacteria bacterium]
MANETYLVLDIETIPDRQVYPPPEAQPGQEKAFPPLYACRAVVIGVLWLDEDLSVKRLGTIGDGRDEGETLRAFSDFMGKHKPHLVTWNGRGFDMPVLALRALRHAVPFPWYYRDKDVRFRFNELGHIDLCDFLSDYGAASRTSLAGAAKLIGLPGKDGVDGSQVEGLYNAGQMDALKAYCLSDVAQTAFVFLRYKLLSGGLEREAYRKAARGLWEALSADGRFARLIENTDVARLLLDEPPAAV